MMVSEEELLSKACVRSGLQTRMAAYGQTSVFAKGSMRALEQSLRAVDSRQEWLHTDRLLA